MKNSLTKLLILTAAIMAIFYGKASAQETTKEYGQYSRKYIARDEDGTIWLINEDSSSVYTSRLHQFDQPFCTHRPHLNLWVGPWYNARRREVFKEASSYYKVEHPYVAHRNWDEPHARYGTAPVSIATNTRRTDNNATTSKYFDDSKKIESRRGQNMSIHEIYKSNKARNENANLNSGSYFTNSGSSNGGNSGSINSGNSVSKELISDPRDISAKEKH